MTLCCRLRCNSVLYLIWNDYFRAERYTYAGGDSTPRDYEAAPRGRGDVHKVIYRLRAWI